jgi:hypothetical protein
MASSRRRRVSVAAFVALLALGGGGYAWSSYRAAAGDYAHVDTIRDDATFQRAALLERAWALPVAATYRERFVFQPNGSFCGPTSVVDAVRSLGGEASTDDVLEGTGIETVMGVLPGGITLDQLAELARMRLPGHRVTVLRDLDLAGFRELVAARANDTSARLLVNFHRGPLFATGGGHHSPIGGYLPDEDLVFVLDVNDSYDPWLAPTERLFEAIDTVDPSTGERRGLLVIEGEDG